jgi:UDP-glucose 4-epimerase
LAKVFSGKEVVFLLASNPDIQKAVTQPRIDFDQGTKIVESVVEACRLSSVQFLVFASGSGVYGERGSAVLDEDSALDPISTYGASKIAGEKLLIAYAHMFGIKARIYRFANVVGPNQTHGVVYDFVSKLKKDPTRLEILGDGNQIKSYIHVSDVINAIDTTFLLNDKLYEIYNVSTNELVTVNMIAEMCIHKLEIQKSKIEISYSGGDRGWNGDVPKVILDSSKLRSLGWKPKYDSISAIEVAIEDVAKSK